MKIYKYGGHILKNKATRESIYKQIKNETEQIIMVVSAFKDTAFSTDNLLGLVQDSQDYYLKERMQTIGELVSSLIICNELKEQYVNSDIVYPEQLGITITKEFDRITDIQLDGSFIVEKLKHCQVLVCPGFIALDQNHQLVTLNRGGSDLSAILIAKMTNLSEVTFFKDVPGVGLCDPKYYINNKILANVSYDKMIDFARHGSNLLQIDAIKKAKEYNIAMRIRHFAIQNTGTLINDKKGDSSLGIHILNNKVYIDGYGNASYIKKILFENEIPYDLLITINENIEISTSHQNEKEILSIICSRLFRS